MDRRYSFYKLSAYAILLYILYAFATHFIVDPGAEAFLQHKVDIEHEWKPQIWLTVMYIHVGFACLAMASGFINFSARTYETHRRFHRVNGYVYVSSVLIVILTSGYMAPYATGGKISSMGFNLLNILWLFLTSTALIQIFQKRVLQHRRWMIRSFAFCFTNLLIHLFTFVFHQLIGIAYVTSYTLGLYSTILLVLLIPEVLIRMGKPFQTYPHPRERRRPHI